MGKKVSKCVLLCASPYVDKEYVKSQIFSGDFIICADGGYDLAKSINLQPNIVIGDFDSAVSKDIIGDVIKLPVKKDDTDTMVCLKYALEKGYKDILILGGTGARLDHTIANLTALKYVCRNGGRAVLDDEAAQIIYTESVLEINNKNGATVSIFPFGCEKATVTLTGFEYEVKNFTMTSDFPIGVSNISKENATVNIHSGGVIIIINKHIN